MSSSPKRRTHAWYALNNKREADMKFKSNEILKKQMTLESKRMAHRGSNSALLLEGALSRIEELEHLARPRKTPVLMSANNPDGWALESLAPQLANEVIAKDLNIQGDTRPQVIEARLINKQIIDHLHAVRTLQERNRTLFAELGKDQGPLGNPRAGWAASDEIKNLSNASAFGLVIIVVAITATIAGFAYGLEYVLFLSGVIDEC